MKLTKIPVAAWAGCALMAMAPLRAQVLTQSPLPIVIIDTQYQTIPDEPKITATMRIVWNGPGRINSVSDTTSHYSGCIGIEKRGSSSQWYFPKKQYALETRMADGCNNNCPLLGMPAENDWILSAPYSDKTLMRNVLTYELWRNMGYYGSRSRFCELILNSQYEGIYILAEKIKIDDGRLDLSRLRPEDVEGDQLTGSYLIKIDKEDGSKNQGWYSQYRPRSGGWQQLLYQYHDPDQNELTPEQKAYIQGEILYFETVMNSSRYNDENSGYSQIIDVESFVDFFLINELTRNVDGYRLSVFLHKDRDSVDPRLKVGPVWDFNLGFGNADYYSGWLTEGWQIESLFTESDFYSDPYWPPFWWSKLWQDEVFRYQTALRWNDLRRSLITPERFQAQTDSLSQFMSDALTRNYERWPNALGRYVWPNPAGWQSRSTHALEVQWMLAWIEARIAWMDEALAEIQSSVEESTAPENQLSKISIAVFPNPASEKAELRTTVPCSDRCWIELYNSLGQHVQTLYSGYIQAGAHAWTVNAQELPSGIYMAVVRTSASMASKKMLVLK